MTKRRIFLADDHPVMREGLKSLINSQPDMEVIGEAANGETACAKSGELRSDIVVMDVSMSGLNGAEATEQIKASWPNIKVLALTVHEDKGYLRLLLEAGATGYILKRTAADELIHAIRIVADGGLYLDPSLTRTVVASFVRQTSDKSGSPTSGLSEREAEVVRLIAAGHSNKEIAARLALSVKTVETYKARSLEKLGLSSRADLVGYALQRGWLQGG